MFPFKHSLTTKTEETEETEENRGNRGTSKKKSTQNAISAKNHMEGLLYLAKSSLLGEVPHILALATETSFRVNKYSMLIKCRFILFKLYIHSHEDKQIILLMQLIFTRKEVSVPKDRKWTDFAKMKTLPYPEDTGRPNVCLFSWRRKDKRLLRVKGSLYIYRR
jgi:hypothetical protein